MLLKRGSRGPGVRDLQRRLQELGYSPGPVDGIFGPRTEAAVRDFQRDSGLAADGIVGPRTRANLESPQCRATSRPLQPSAPRPPRQEMPGSAGEPRWLIIARREVCTRQAFPGSQSNPRIVEYHQATSLRAQDDRTPWCAAFAVVMVEDPDAGRNGLLLSDGTVRWMDESMGWGALADAAVSGVTINPKQ